MFGILNRKRRRLRPSPLGPTTGLLGGLGVSDRIAAFRSLGGNCEFGFVQRYCGAEPSGLFRFAYTEVERLTHAIEDSLDKYGAAGDLRLEETESGTYYCASQCYNFWYNTQTRAKDVDKAAFLDEQYGRVAHLKRAFLRDLASGDKILVRKPQEGEDPIAFMTLAQAIGRHGPSTLLRVTEAAGEPSLRRTSERMLEGTIRRLSQTERNYETDLEAWIGLCDAAYAAHRGLLRVPTETIASSRAADHSVKVRWIDALVSVGALRDPAAAAVARTPRPAGSPMRHDTDLPGSVLNAYTVLLDIAAFDARTVYVFSAWVWIAADFTASRVFAVVGTERLGWFDADLGLRDCWQRVWAAGRVVPRTTERPCAGLGVVGEPGQHVWSYGWELREGPIPAPAEAPTVSVDRPLLRRLLNR